MGRSTLRGMPRVVPHTFRSDGRTERRTVTHGVLSPGQCSVGAFRDAYAAHPPPSHCDACAFAIAGYLCLSRPYGMGLSEA